MAQAFASCASDETNRSSSSRRVKTIHEQPGAARMHEIGDRTTGQGAPPARMPTRLPHEKWSMESDPIALDRRQPLMPGRSVPAR